MKIISLTIAIVASFTVQSQQISQLGGICLEYSADGGHVCAEGLFCQLQRPSADEGGKCVKPPKSVGEKCNRKNRCHVGLECKAGVCAQKISSYGEVCDEYTAGGKNTGHVCDEGLVCQEKNEVLLDLGGKCLPAK
ncbi:hypothetical protein HDU92_000584 [Lobulomyces angularis]|nr:hypothetical protein HDU92_000584 [Lobulomyces angularis]